MKKLICSLLAISIATSILLAQNVSPGDYITVTLEGKNTYTIGEGTDQFKCFIHGKYDGAYSYYQPVKGGWTSIDSKKIKPVKFKMPKVGEEVYVLKQDFDFKNNKWVYRAKKGILKAHGAGSWDTHKLGIKAEIIDGAGNPSIESFNYFASKEELSILGWTLGNPTIADADLKEIETKIYAAINEARANPKGFARRIQPNDNTAKEAISFLNNMGAVTTHQFKSLHRKKGMDRAAREHAAEHAANASVGHKGASADCSKKTDYLSCRLNRHGTVSGFTGENIFRGGAQMVTGSGVVLALIQDHGIPSRGHRAAFFDTYGDNLTADKTNVDKYMCAYEAIGVGCAYDKKSGNISCVIDFADGYK